MKNLFSSAWRCRQNSFVTNYGFIHNAVLFFCTTILTGFLFTSCQKQALNESKSINPLSIGNSNQISTDNNGNSQADPLRPRARRLAAR